MEAIKPFPYHGFETRGLALYFYEVLTMRMKECLECICNGGFLDKLDDDATDFLNTMAELTKGCKESNTKYIRRARPHPRRGIYYVQTTPCYICDSYEHHTANYPPLPAIKETFGEQANFVEPHKPQSIYTYGNS